MSNSANITPNSLSDEQINMLMERYYEGESAKKLIAEYGLKLSPSKICSIFPPEVFDNYICEYCNIPLKRKRPPRALKDAPKYERDLYCAKCGHKQYDNACKCDNCIDKAQRKKEEQLLLIKKTYSQNIKQISFDDLSFRTKVYLGALCRSLLNENLNEIRPRMTIKPPNPPLCPTNDYTDKLYKDLTKNKAIRVSPNSPIEAFSQEKNDTFPHSYYIYYVIYELNLLPTDDKEQLIYNILNPTYCSEDDKEIASLIWLEIALEECKEYLLNQLNKVGFEFSPGEKTMTVLKALLMDFSVSQVYAIIWKCVADASKLFLETRMPKLQAANSVIGACERYGERAKENNWDIKKYSRQRDLPQSVISEFFFNKVVGIGQMGFDLPPTSL